MQYAKRNAHRPVEKRKGNKKLPYIHVQDIEDYNSEFHRKKFYGMIDEMRDAEDEFRITYELGYSNYTFELWMLLHAADMNHAVLDRKAYLAPIRDKFPHMAISEKPVFRGNTKKEPQLSLGSLGSLDAVVSVFLELSATSSCEVVVSFSEIIASTCAFSSVLRSDPIVP